LAKRCQRRRLKKSANQKQDLPVAAMFEIAHFGLIGLQTWWPQAIPVSDWSISKKSSSLKPLVQMNRNLIGNIYGRSSIQNAHFVPIR
jgi:hypothetical protein